MCLGGEAEQSCSRLAGRLCLPVARICRNQVSQALLGSRVGCTQAGYPNFFWLLAVIAVFCPLLSEQCFKTALGDHGEQARQRERREDPLQHETQRAGECLGCSKTSDSLRASYSSTVETGGAASTPEVLQEVCAWVAANWKTFQGFNWGDVSAWFLGSTSGKEALPNAMEEAFSILQKAGKEHHLMFWNPHTEVICTRVRETKLPCDLKAVQ